jgi:hypothetical protein
MSESYGKGVLGRYKRRKRDAEDAKCEHCGSKEKLTVDHIVPKGRGGRSGSVHNFQVLCEPCNTKKGDKLDKVKGIPPKALREGLKKPLPPRLGKLFINKAHGVPLRDLEPMELGSILHRLSLIGKRGRNFTSALSRAKALAEVAAELQRRIRA